MNAPCSVLSVSRACAVELSENVNLGKQLRMAIARNAGENQERGRIGRGSSANACCLGISIHWRRFVYFYLVLSANVKQLSGGLILTWPGRLGVYSQILQCSVTQCCLPGYL